MTNMRTYMVLQLAVKLFIAKIIKSSPNISKNKIQAHKMFFLLPFF